MILNLQPFEKGFSLFSDQEQDAGFTREKRQKILPNFSHKFQAVSINQKFPF